MRFATTRPVGTLVQVYCPECGNRWMRDPVTGENRDMRVRVTRAQFQVLCARLVESECAFCGTPMAMEVLEPIGFPTS